MREAIKQRLEALRKLEVDPELGVFRRLAPEAAESAQTLLGLFLTDQKNPMPQLSIGAEGGLCAEWPLNDRGALVLEIAASGRSADVSTWRSPTSEIDEQDIDIEDTAAACRTLESLLLLDSCPSLATESLIANC